MTQELRRDETAPASVADITEFVYLEARLADEWQLTEWLALWEPEGDGRYWVPAGHDAVDPGREVSLIYDDWKLLNERIARLTSSAAHVQDPRSRLRRVVSNIEMLDEGQETTVVGSNFVLGAFRNEMQTVLIGRAIHELVPDGPSFKIRSKKVLLINNGGFLENISFIL